jgi:hypothetical protein
MPRKQLPKKEKKHPIRIFVKKKNYAKAKAAAKEIERIYNTEKSNSEVRA